MSAHYAPKYLKYGGFAVISGISLIEAVTSLLGTRDRARINEIRAADSRRVVIYFPGLGMDAAASSQHFLPYFVHDSVVLVDYPHTGFNHHETFAVLTTILRQHPGEEVILLGVSLGSSVAIGFRRYLLNRPDTRDLYKKVKFIFYSSVTGSGDVNLQSKLIAALGFMLRGGIISEQLWKILKRVREANPHIRFPSEYAEIKYAELQDILSRIPMKMLAAELREVHYAQRGRKGEFANDSALILTYKLDHVVLQSAYDHLAKAFGLAEISEVLENGHADLRLAVSTEQFRSALQRFMAA